MPDTAQFTGAVVTESSDVIRLGVEEEIVAFVFEPWEEMSEDPVVVALRDAIAAARQSERFRLYVRPTLSNNTKPRAVGICKP